jgi:hypothetical protein
MNFAKLKIVEVPRALRAEIETHDLIEEALKQSGLYDEILESVQSGDRETFEHLLIAFEHLLNAFRIYKCIKRSDLDGSPERGRPRIFSADGFICWPTIKCFVAGYPCQLPSLLRNMGSPKDISIIHAPKQIEDFLLIQYVTNGFRGYGDKTGACIGMRGQEKRRNIFESRGRVGGASGFSGVTGATGSDILRKGIAVISPNNCDFPRSRASWSSLSREKFNGFGGNKCALAQNVILSNKICLIRTDACGQRGSYTRNYSSPYGDVLIPAGLVLFGIALFSFGTCHSILGFGTGNIRRWAFAIFISVVGYVVIAFSLTWAFIAFPENHSGNICVYPSYWTLPDCSQASSTSTISFISQRRLVTPAAIAGVIFKV